MRWSSRTSDGSRDRRSRQAGSDATPPSAASGSPGAATARFRPMPASARPNSTNIAARETWCGERPIEDCPAAFGGSTPPSTRNGRSSDANTSPTSPSPTSRPRPARRQRRRHLPRRHRPPSGAARGGEPLRGAARGGESLRDARLEGANLSTRRGSKGRTSSRRGSKAHLSGRAAGRARRVAPGREPSLGGARRRRTGSTALISK
jgi:hypothetical protein